MTRSSTLRVLALLAALGAGPVSAQAGAVPQPAAEAASPGSAPAPSVAQAEAPTTASGLPRQAPPPRTLRAYWHLFGAFSVTCVLIFGYTLTLGRRFARLEETVRGLGREG